MVGPPVLSLHTQGLHDAYCAVAEQEWKQKKQPALTRMQRPTSVMFTVPRDLDHLTKINGFPGLMVEHFYVEFGDPTCNPSRRTEFK